VEPLRVRSAMIGFTDEEEGEQYGLMQNSSRASRKRWLSAPAALALLLVGAALAVIALTSPASPAKGGAPLELFAAGKEAKGQAEACKTKPFGQCAGMNFSLPKADRKQYNITAGPGDAFACCPGGMSCMTFGPVWGMCMPSWAPAKPKEADTLMTAMQLYAVEHGPFEWDAQDEKLPAVALAAKAKGAVEKKEEAQPPPTEAPCATKPFGQCAGMNFTAPKAALGALNFTGTAAPLSCCPDGTKCVSFGPVWGMCMPSFGPTSWGPGAWGGGPSSV